MNTNVQQKEVDHNYEAFKRMLPQLLEKNAGRFALMQNREIINIFDTSDDAFTAGSSFLEGNFSVQEITIRCVQLGYFSHASIFRNV